LRDIAQQISILTNAEDFHEVQLGFHILLF